MSHYSNNVSMTLANFALKMPIFVCNVEILRGHFCPDFNIQEEEKEYSSHKHDYSWLHAKKMICERLRMQHCSKKTVITLVVVGIEAGSGNPDRSFSAGKKQLKLSKYLRRPETKKKFGWLNRTKMMMRRNSKFGFFRENFFRISKQPAKGKNKVDIWSNLEFVDFKIFFTQSLWMGGHQL